MDIVDIVDIVNIEVNIKVNIVDRTASVEPRIRRQRRQYIQW